MPIYSGTYNIYFLPIDSIEIQYRKSHNILILKNCQRRVQSNILYLESKLERIRKLSSGTGGNYGNKT